jgi:hypothetical protein
VNEPTIHGYVIAGHVTRVSASFRLLMSRMTPHRLEAICNMDAIILDGEFVFEVFDLIEQQELSFINK